MKKKQSRPAARTVAGWLAFLSLGRIATRGATHMRWNRLSTIPASATLSIAALALSGCATTRYVTVACIDQPQLQRLKDAEPERVGDRLTGQAQDDFKIATGSAVQLRAWGEGLIGVLEGCQEPPR